MSPLRQQLVTAMQARNYSEHTQRTYLQVVKQLDKYTTEALRGLTSVHIQEFILYLAKTKKLSWKTCNTYACAIRFFYKAVLGKNLDEFYIPLARTEDRIPEILTQSEIKTLLSHVTLDKYRLMFMLMYSAGLRISEVVKLTVNDIDSTEHVIIVRQGKGNKDRYTPLSHHMLSELRHYWKRYRPVDFLFLSQKTKQPISTRNVRTFFAKALAKMKSKKHVTVHSLRHSFATHLLEGGTDLIDIKQCLGHASFSSTVRYLRFSKKIIAKVVSPLDR